MLVDTHCHLDFDRYDDDRPAVVQRAIDAGVQRIIIPAVDLDKIPQVLAVADQFEEVYAAVGVHPNSTANLPDDWLYQIERFAEHPKVLAIGEIGIDYYWDDSPKETQHAAFRDQLELAFDLALPVIIHNRDASQDVITLLKESSLSDIEKPGVLHSFLAEPETAQAAIDMGFFLGFTGPITYKKNEWLRDILKSTPTDRILLETDGPFLAPQKHRGQRNEPAYVKEMARFAARHFKLDEETFSNMTTENAACLFGREEIYGA